MRIRNLFLFLFILCMLTACRQKKSVESAQPAESTAAMTAAPTEATVSSEETAAAPTVECETEPADEDFVKILDWIPTARQQLFYATSQNFTGQAIYDFEDAYLRYGTLKKLKAVSEDLAELGLYLKIWDGFRPVSAQFKLWEIYPNSTYVANPNVGFSSHSRGNTVDLTLVDENGAELEMPTEFDDFSAKADRDYSDCTETEANNAKILEILMEKHGFTGYFGEWWHYSDTEKYPVEEVFEPSAAE